MDQLTPLQMGAVANARTALDMHDAYLPRTINDINAAMALPWQTDPETFFAALGDQAANLWADLGQRINDAMRDGADYSALTKPARVCVVCADGHVVPTAVPFPTEPIAVWHIPAATRDDALALLAQGASAILDALLAAQPA